MYIFALIVRIVMLVLMASSSIMLIVAVLVQQGNTEGVSAIQGQSASNSDTFYGRNRGKKRENLWRKWTVILGIILALSSIIFFIVEIFS